MVNTDSRAYALTVLTTGVNSAKSVNDWYTGTAYCLDNLHCQPLATLQRWSLCILQHHGDLCKVSLGPSWGIELQQDRFENKLFGYLVDQVLWRAAGRSTIRDAVTLFTCTQASIVNSMLA